MVVVELALAAVITASPAAAPPVDAPGEVRGIVLSEDSEEPIPGVHVTVGSRVELAISDDAGAYAIRDLPHGRHTLRFSRFGYHDLTVEILVSPGSARRLDVSLRPRPIAMPPLSAIGSAAEPGPSGVGPPRAGTRTVTDFAIRNAPLSGEPDVLRAFESDPSIAMAEELPTGIHVQGGSADQNQVLVDGLPLYNAYHSAGILTGVNPDAVSTATLHSGALAARYGGRLSSVVSIETRVPPARVGFRGGLGPGDGRLVAGAPFPTGGGVLVAGRRTIHDALGGGGIHDRAAASFEEILTRASIPTAAGRVDLVSIRGQNELSFFTYPDGDDAPSPSDPDSYSSVGWITETHGATWSRSDGEGARARASAWWAESRSGAAWGSGAGRNRFAQELEHRGLRLEIARATPSGTFHSGLGLDRVSTSYEATTAYSGPPGAALATDATSATLFVDHRWIPHDRWLVDHGVRAVVGVDGSADLEPRLSIHYRPARRVELSAGYARIHQYLQSMRNEESVLSAAFGFEPLVSAADPRVPTARSDQVTASARVDLSADLRLEVQAYARRLDGLLLVAPATPQPFVVHDFSTGRGSAHGIGAALFHRGAATDLDVVARWNSSNRRTRHGSYRATFARGGSLTAGVIRRIGGDASLRAALRAGSGRPTSALASGFAWEPLDRYSGEVEFGGIPLRRAGALNDERLSPYVRLDLGARKAWSVPRLGGTITTRLDVLDLLDRKNALALLERPEGGLDAILRSGRTLVLGIDWDF